MSSNLVTLTEDNSILYGKNKILILLNLQHTQQDNICAPLQLRLASCAIECHLSR